MGLVSLRPRYEENRVPNIEEHSENHLSVLNGCFDFSN